MSGNQFDIYARWGVREDPPERLGQRMLRSLDALPKLNPLFEHWWMTDHSLTLDDLQNLEPGQGGFPLDEVRSRMAEIVERGVKKADDGDPTPLLGYGMSALNSPISSSKSVCLMVSGGDSVNEWGSRWATFSTEYGEFPDPSIVAYPVFKGALLTIVSCWNPGYAQAYSSDLMKLWNKPYRFHLELSWMTYLSEPQACRIVLPSNVLIERTDDGGVLMIAAEETFDVSNPKHVAAARSMRDAFAPLNDEWEQEWKNRWSKGSA
jgi:Immunity protein 52